MTPAPLSPAAATDAAAPRDPKLWQAAQNFEAMAIGQLLAPMFDTVDTAHGSFGGGDAEAAWRPMMVDALGRQIATHGGFGLAQPVYDALLRAQEGSAGAAALRQSPAARKGSS